MNIQKTPIRFGQFTEAQSKQFESALAGKAIVSQLRVKLAMANLQNVGEALVEARSSEIPEKKAVLSYLSKRLIKLFEGIKKLPASNLLFSQLYGMTQDPQIPGKVKEAVKTAAREVNAEATLAILNEGIPPELMKIMSPEQLLLAQKGIQLLEKFQTELQAAEAKNPSEPTSTDPLADLFREAAALPIGNVLIAAMNDTLQDSSFEVPDTLFAVIKEATDQTGAVVVSLLESGY